jgi:hypothetical protein
MHVVLPEQVVRDDGSSGMDDGDGAHEWEPFIALEV